MDWIKNLKVGDVVNLGGSYRGGIDQETVVKAGRKWVTTKGDYGREHQFSVETGRENTSFNPRFIIEDVETYKDQIRCRSLYNQLRNGMNWIPSKGVTANDVLEAAKKLKIELRQL